MPKKRKINYEKGSIAVYAIATTLCFFIILGVVFVVSVGIRKNELRTLIKIKEIYAQKINETDMIMSPPYITEGLIIHYDGINNTGNGHSNTTTTWKDLSGNENNATLVGFDSTSGWQDNYLKFDGVNDYAISTKNLGISGNTELTMCAVAQWDGTSWVANYPSYMGNNSNSSYTGLSMTMYNGRPALDFWNYRYISNTALSVKTIYQICLTKKVRVY